MPYEFAGRRVSNLGFILETIIGATDLAVAGTTASINYDRIKAAEKKKRLLEEGMLKDQEDNVAKSIAHQKSLLSQKASLTEKADTYTHRAVITVIVGLVILTGFGMGVAYNVI